MVNEQLEIEFKGASQVEHPEHTLDKYKPLASTYAHGDETEQVTIPDMSPSLHQMVVTGVAGTTSGKYSFVDVDEDDHDAPDYEKLSKADPALKAEFMDSFINNPDNYEKREEKPEVVDTQKTEENAGGSEQDPTA